MLTRIEAATTDEYFAELKASSKYDHGRFVAMLEQMRNTLAQLDERTSDDALKARIVAGQAKISAEIGSVPAAAAPTAGWAKNAEGKWRLSEAE